MRLISIIFSFFMMSINISLTAQESFQLTGEEADCEKAIDISGLFEIVSTAPVGSGKWMEIKSDKLSLYSFKKEHNTVWYSFVVSYDCELTFTISPDNPKNDYDFLLYRSFPNQSCLSIKKGELKPIRSNISRPTNSNLGRTGLSSKASANYVHEGKGNSWSLPVQVKKGEVYFLVLDNVYDNGEGHRLEFYYRNCKDETKEHLTLKLNIIDKESRRLLNANILLVDQSQGYKAYDTIYNKNSSSLIMALEPSRYYQYEVSLDGYLMENDVFKLDSTDKTKVANVELQKVEKGDTFELGDLYFVGGSADIVRKSYPTLRKLLAVMKDNTSLHIDIQGHVNYSRSSRERKTEEYYNQLSVDRAKAVSNYLSKRGVDPSRITCQGFGYSEMLFPNATSLEQMQRNRRVVIMITEF